MRRRTRLRGLSAPAKPESAKGPKKRRGGPNLLPLIPIITFGSIVIIDALVDDADEQQQPPAAEDTIVDTPEGNSAEQQPVNPEPTVPVEAPIQETPEQPSQEMANITALAGLIEITPCDDPIIHFDTNSLAYGVCLTESNLLTRAVDTQYGEQLTIQITNTINATWPTETGEGFLHVDDAYCSLAVRRFTEDGTGGMSWSNVSDTELCGQAVGLITAAQTIDR